MKYFSFWRTLAAILRMNGIEIFSCISSSGLWKFHAWHNTNKGKNNGEKERHG